MNSNGREKSRDAEHKIRRAQRRHRRRTTIIWMLVITVFSILVLAIVHFAPLIIQKFTIVDEYLPQDLDRQYRQYKDLQDIKKQMQDIRKQ